VLGRVIEWRRHGATSPILVPRGHGGDILRSVKVRAVCGCGVLAATVAIAAAAAAKPAEHVQCPLKTGTPSGGHVQWAFTESGAPSGRHPGIRTSYTHGRGTWTAGRATGTVCSQDSLSGGGSRDLVLPVAGRAKLSPRIIRLGKLGVSLVVPVRISASDDSACVVGTHGTVTLFASYYAVHNDSVSLHFARGCADHDHRYTGSGVHVLIAHDGAQVNST